MRAPSARQCGSLVLAMLLVIPLLSSAEAPASAPAGGEGADQQDLAKAVQNPVADLISVPLQDNLDLGVEPGERVRNTLNIQPVVPLPLTREFNLIARVILPNQLLLQYFTH